MKKFLELKVGQVVVEAKEFKFSKINKMAVLTVLEIRENGKVIVGDNSGYRDEFYMESINHGMMHSLEEYIALLKEYEVFSKEVESWIARRYA